MRLLFFLLIISALKLDVFSQEDSLNYTKKYIFFRDGSVIRGEMIYLKEAKDILIRQQDGTTIKKKKRRISKIRKDRDQYAIMNNGTLYYKTKGFYHGINFQLMTSKPNNSGTFTSISGYGAQYSAGHYFNKNVAVGGGIGIAYYGNGFLEFFGQARFLLPREMKKMTPLVGLDAGYGFPIRQNDTFENTVNGGFSFRPNVGI